MMYNYIGNYGYYPSHMFGLGPIFMFVFWGLIICGVIMIVRHNRHGGRRSHALDILKERYAKGEITKDQFDSIRKDLQ